MPDTYYSPNQAVNEYQSRLAAQKAADKVATQHTPDDMVAVYELKSRVPDYNMLLNMGCGKGGLSVYSSDDLLLALKVLAEEISNPYWYKPGEYHFGLSEQLDRIYEEALEQKLFV